MLTLASIGLQFVACGFLVLHFRFGHTKELEAADRVLNLALRAVPRLWPPWTLYKAMWRIWGEVWQKRREEARRRRSRKAFIFNAFHDRYSPGSLETTGGSLLAIASILGVVWAIFFGRETGISLAVCSGMVLGFLAITSVIRPLFGVRVLARRHALGDDPVLETLALYAPPPQIAVVARHTLGASLVLPIFWVLGAPMALAVLVFWALNLVLVPVFVLGLLLVGFVVGAQLYIADRIAALTRKLTTNQEITASPLQMLFAWTEAASFMIAVWLLVD